MKKQIKHADEIVTFTKNVSATLMNWEIIDNLDFSGCSKNYVKEKVNLLIRDLDWIKHRLDQLAL